MNVPASGAVTAVDLKGKATIRVLSFSIPRDQAAALRTFICASPGTETATFHRCSHGSFLRGRHLYNRDHREYLVKAFPSNIRFSRDRIYLVCYFPMPFFRSARIELVGAGSRSMPSNGSAVHAFAGARNQLAYFHATYRDFPNPTPGRRPGAPRHRRRGRSESGRGTLSAHRLSSLTMPTCEPWKVIHASSSMTVLRRRRRVPAQKNGAAAETIGAV